MEIERFTIELKLSGRDKPNCAFNIARRQNLATVVNAGRKRDVNEALAKAPDDSLAETAVTAKDDAVENRSHLLSNDRALFFHLSFSDQLTNRRLRALPHESDGVNVVFQQWDLDRLGGCFHDDTVGAGEGGGDGRLVNQFFGPLDGLREGGHVLMKDRVHVNILVAQIVERLCCHATQHANRGDVLNAMSLFRITK